MLINLGCDVVVADGGWRLVSLTDTSIQ